MPSAGKKLCHVFTLEELASRSVNPNFLCLFIRLSASAIYLYFDRMYKALESLLVLSGECSLRRRNL